MRKEFLVYGQPRIEEDEIQEVVDTLRSGWIGTGPKVSKFQEDFSAYTGAKYAMALNSCTAALHLSLVVLGLQPGDEVITTPMTFCASANAIIHAGAIPVFADIDRETFNIDPAAIEAKITDKTRAILPVHFAGRPCDMDKIMDIAKKHNLYVVEDCAHAIETRYQGKQAGTFGDIGCFSFYVTKNLVTGEGGMVITNNEEYANKVKVYGLHGMSKDAWKRFSDEGFKHYEVVFHGFKYNMTDMQASLGIKQLPKVENYLLRREKIWRKYDEAFADLPLILPLPEQENTRHARHLYTVLIDDKANKSRDEVLNALQKENIGTGVHYIALNLHPYYQDRFGYRRGDFPNAEFVSDRTLSLPLSAKLTDEDVEDVVAAVRNVLA